MKRWNDRQPTPSIFDIRGVRSIGEWGHASRHVGSRWEEVGLDLLRAGVAGRSPAALLPVCLDPDLQAALASTGSKNPDVVLVFASDEGIVLQPADLKWSLDVASYRQINASVLSRLLDNVPRLTEAIRVLLPSELLAREDLQARPWTTRDGFFFCPRSIANERFVTSPENNRQEYPIEEHEVLMQEIDPFAFFEPLPGWTTGRELARTDRSGPGLKLLDNADRYYHLGTGVAGALVSLETSIFDEDLPIDPTKEAERFREYLKTVSPPVTASVIDRLWTTVRRRLDLVRELRDLTRSTFSFRDFAAVLVQGGAASAEDSETALRRLWSEAYRALVDAQDVEIRKAGRLLRSKGSTDAQALEKLGQERDRFAARLRVRAQALVKALPVHHPSTTPSSGARSID